MYARPVPTETDDDLLVQQEEFLKNLKQNKIQIAAKVVGSSKEENEVQETSAKTIEDIGNDVQEQLANTFESIPSNVNIGRIVEKRKIEDDKETTRLLVFNKSCGFPAAKKRDVNVKSSTRSIFSQQMKRNKVVNNSKSEVILSENNSHENIQPSMDVDVENNVDFSMNVGNIVKESKILTENDKDEINKQNVNLLKATPESEILEEREKLLSTMDPAIITFLKERRRERILKTSNLSIHQQNEQGQSINIESIKATAEILDNVESEKWLNFDLLETHKLAWMKEIEVPKIDKNKAFEARFDFEGWLLPFTEPEMNEKNRILYHHGEEPERPGYTLQELFTLARSSVIQQKIIALNSIANILALYSTGVYQDILEIPIEQLFFLIRFCLDDNSPGVLNASIKAMKCLICSKIDEICLDGLLGFGWNHILPILPVDHENEDDNTINDQQLAETNLIRCLVRTGIYTRIRYILNTVRPPLETIVYCLEICIRLAEDSEFVVSEMYKSENLIPSIMTNFVPSSDFHNNQESAYGKPILQAIKLVRVLCSRNKTIACEFVNSYSILKSIAQYLQDDIFGFNANGMKLQTECFHLWRILLEYNLTLEHTSTLESILLKHLNYHVNHTDVSADTTYIREGHCSGILSLLGKFLAVKPSFISKFENLIQICLKKWCLQFHKTESFKCGKSQIISSLICMCTMVYGYSKLTEIFDESLLNVIKSTGFLNSTQYIHKCSMLLNNYEPQPFSPNLKTLQTSAWYTADHVIPIMQTTSCFPFLSSFSKFVSTSGNYTIKLRFLTHPHIKDYINSLNKRKSHFLTNHWFTRIESELVMNILKISVDIQRDLDTSIFYALAVKALCVFNGGQKKGVEFLLEKIIFCQSFYPSEVLLKNLDLNERNENLETSLKNLNEIREVYSEILGLKEHGVTDVNFCVDIGIGNIIPVDWIYTPIILLYSQQEDKKAQLSEEQQIFVIKNCLRWILIYETYFPSLVAAVNPTDRFCRLACVFLGSDGLFLNNEIHNLLELCLKNILGKFENKLNFDQPIQGMNNFQDFYNQMLEQYQGVSYGDILFGNFILVPLSQKQNVKWRKILWSEYMGAVQILNIPKEKLLTTLENYLHPPEEDESLLKCYKIALVGSNVRQTSVLHLIATSHYKEYMKRRTSSIQIKK